MIQCSHYLRGYTVNLVFIFALNFKNFLNFILNLVTKWFI